MPKDRGNNIHASGWLELCDTMNGEGRPPSILFTFNLPQSQFNTNVPLEVALYGNLSTALHNEHKQSILRQSKAPLSRSRRENILASLVITYSDTHLLPVSAQGKLSLAPHAACGLTILENFGNRPISVSNEREGEGKRSRISTTYSLKEGEGG